MISDFLKQQYNADQQPSLYFWRDKTGHEIDCIIDEPQYPIPVEIKAGKTVVSDFFKEFNYWEKTSGTPEAPKYLIYGGVENQSWPQAEVLGWQSAGNLIEKLKTK